MVSGNILRLQDYLEHIIQAIEEIESYTQGMDFVTFEQDKRTQRAVVMCFIIIGEASTKISQKFPDFANENSHIAWQAMKGMRNQLAHGYFAINLKIVWNTIERALPTLKKQLNDLQTDPN